MTNSELPAPSQRAVEQFRELLENDMGMVLSEEESTTLARRIFRLFIIGELQKAVEGLSDKI